VLSFGVIAIAMPEPPRNYPHQNFAPQLRQQIARQVQPSSDYGPPSVPNLPSDGYGPSIPQPPQITKSFYVHLPPEDNEPPRTPQVIQPPTQPRKHYKLIFIKAPEAPKYEAPIIPPQQQDEEKTLVYVLVKKPDEQPQITLPQIEPTVPSKPEVYFIKYQQNSPHSEYGPPKPEYGAPQNGNGNPPVVDFGPPVTF
jgi:hypothetical protein